MNQTQIQELLSQLSPFASLPTTFAAELASQVRVREHLAKEYLFHEGDDAGEGFILLSGRVALMKNSPNGKELIVELVPPGAPFGLIVLLEEKPYPLTARAQIDGAALVLTRSVTKGLMERYPNLQQALFQVIKNRMLTAHNLARAIAHDRAETRLATVLLALIPKLPLSEEKPPQIIISRQEIADLTAMTLETASRVTKAFEREGLLDASELGVLTILDPERLQQFVEPFGA